MAQGMFAYCGQESALVELIRHALIMEAIPITADISTGGGMIGIGAWTYKEREKDALERHYRDKHLEAATAVAASENMAKRSIELAFVLRLGLSAAKESLDRISDYPLCLLQKFL